jgi:helix-turn-helix protein
MKNIKNDKIENNLKENKVALSFREFENKKVLFRFFNTKREKSLSFRYLRKSEIFEKY